MRHVESKANVAHISKKFWALFAKKTYGMDASPSLLESDQDYPGVGKEQLEFIYHNFGETFFEYLMQSKTGAATLRSIRKGWFTMEASTLRRAQLTGIVARESMINYLEEIYNAKMKKKKTPDEMTPGELAAYESGKKVFGTKQTKYIGKFMLALKSSLYQLRELKRISPTSPG